MTPPVRVYGSTGLISIWENASASATTNFPTAASHPFYTRLNQRLAEHYFDDFVPLLPV